MALSLHAPNQEIRLQIVPAAKAHKLDKLMEALDFHIANTKRKNSKLFLRETAVMIEYILIKDVNDRPEHAHELGRLLTSRKQNILLNLIPYNPTEVSEHFNPPTQEDIDNFFKIITSDEYGIYCRVRQEMGQDIDGACGQLALKSHAEKAQELKDKVDIEDSLGIDSIKKPVTGKVKVLRNKSKASDETTSTTYKNNKSLIRRILSNQFMGGSLFVFSAICLIFYRRLNARK
jgi:sorting nexin-8